MARLLLTLALLACPVIAAAGCGNDGSSSSGASSVAPAGSLVYGEVTLRPEGDQKAAIEDLVAKFPGEGAAGDRIQSLMEKLFSEADTSLSYREDVEPWLGDEAAFYISRLRGEEDPDAAALVATDDEDATVDAVEKAGDARKTEHEGYDVYIHDDGEEAAAVVDGWLVLGTPGGVEAAIDTVEGGDPIEDDERFRETLDDAPEDRLGFVYVDMPGFLEQAERMPGPAMSLGPLRGLFADSILVTADADADAVLFEATVPASLAAGFPVVGEGSGGVGELPGDSWLALAQPDLGKTVESYIGLIAGAVGGRDVIEQQLRSSTGLDLEEDVISWMGDWSLFMRGTGIDNLNGAVVVETSDEEASGRFIDALARLARRTAGPQLTVGPVDVPGGGEGVTMRSRNYPEPIHLFQRDGRVVAAFGDAAANDAIDPAESLAGSPDFTQAEEALGGDYSASFFLAFEPILALAENEGAATDEDYQKAKPYLEPLGALVGGATEDGDKLRSAFALTVK
jgi:Protein of unknown function (DUF3352)